MLDIKIYNFKRNSLINWLERLSVKRKLSIIITLIVLTLLFGVGTFWIGVRVVSGNRAFVQGEGLWAEAQKKAVNNLLKYSSSFNEADYNNFLLSLEVIWGDNKARNELDKKEPDVDIVSRGFVEGGNSMDDMNDMIFLYRKFRNISYMDNAVKIWTEGDLKIEEIMHLGEKMHSIVLADKEKNSNQTMITEELKPILSKIYDIDQKLTVLEKNFSIVLGEGSRKIRDFLFLTIVILNIILGTIVLLIARFIGRLIVQVDNAKSEFVFLASHQLRTPPTSINWFLEMLMKREVGPLNEKQEEYFEEIYKNNKRMITLTNMLLNTSKIELGIFKIMPESTDITLLIKEILKENKLQIKNKNLTVEEKYQADIPLIFVDPKLLSIVFQNIILNSIKYTGDNGKINIEIILKKKGENIGGKKIKKNSLVIRTTDTGYGIPKNEFEKIFTKLFRASNVKKKDTDGTGLGLYLSKMILEKMRGDLWFESEVDKGSIFYIAIPAL